MTDTNENPFAERPPVNADELLAPLAPTSSAAEVDPEHQAIAAAIAAGAIPVFSDEPSTEPPTPPAIIDPEAERAAYAALLAFINAHKDDGTTVTFVDPNTLI